MAKVKLNVGDKAPLFTLGSFNAGKIDLETEYTTRKIVLIFSRYFGCPICQLDLKALLDNAEKLYAKGVKIIYITQSGPMIAQKVISEKKIPFTVIPSTKDGLYAQYGLGLLPLSAMAAIPGKLAAAKKAGFVHGENEGWEQQSPGQFIIDQNGIITHLKKGWLDLEGLLAAL